MEPVILNPKSNFVVVTYWWGRGNFNKNTQRPCPEELSEMEKQILKRQPMTYDQMIGFWQESCKKSNCNYMSVEYPEFVQKGGLVWSITTILFVTTLMFSKQVAEQCFMATHKKQKNYFNIGVK